MALSLLLRPDRDTAGGAILAGCGLLLSGCVGVWCAQGDQTPRVGTHLLLYGLAFFAYLLGLHAARGLAPRFLGMALALAAVWRILLVATPPLLSDDVNRYVWEGRIQRHGGNPYLWQDRPSAPHWQALHDDVWQGVNHKDDTAIYPPLFQLFCRLVVTAHDSVTAMKAALVACEALTLWVLAGILRQRGLPLERLLVLAWSPLSLVEVAGSGHNDCVGALFLSVSLLGLGAGRPLLAAVAAALGAQMKLLPGLVALAWAHRFRLWHAAVAGLVALVLFVPYAAAGAGVWRSLDRYSQHWRFNETLFALLAALTNGASHATAVGALLLLSLCALLAVRRTEPVSAALIVMAASLLLAANVMPWYALWLLPLLVLRDSPGALLFTGTTSLAYLVYPAWLCGEPWQIGWGIRALEYVPCLAVALWARR